MLKNIISLNQITLAINRILKVNYEEVDNFGK